MKKLTKKELQIKIEELEKEIEYLKKENELLRLRELIELEQEHKRSRPVISLDPYIRIGLNTPFRLIEWT